MATNVAAVKLWFFDDADEINLLATPFAMEDGGFELGDVEIDTEYNSVGNYAPFFSGGFNYKPRNVNIKLMAYDFADDEITRLYKNLGRFNNLSKYVEHPLMALYFRLQSGTTSIENGGYMKVLAAEIKASDDMFSIGRIQHQDVLGQSLTLMLTCEPYIYEKNFIKNEFRTLTIGTPSGGSYTYGSSLTINAGGSYNPNFAIRASDIRGDVPSPIGFKIKNNRNNVARIANIYVGTNYGIAYPDWIGTGVSPSTIDYKAFFDGTQNNQYADGNSIDYRFSGRCMAVLNAVNPPVANDLVTVDVKYQGLTAVDSIHYYHTSIVDFNLVGSLTIPYPGRTVSNNYSIDITSTDSSDWNVILIPAWNFRGYISSGYNLPYNNFLYDNPFDNTLYTSAGGAHYNRIGEGIFATPDVNLRGIMVAQGDTGDKWEGEMTITAYYNPRYLYVRNILAT